MKVIIYINGFYKTEALERQIGAIAHALAKRGCQSEVCRNDRLKTWIDGKDVQSALPDADAVIFWDKDTLIAEMLERSGYRVYNSARAIELSDHKFKTYLALCGSGLRMPETINSPLCYAGEDDGIFLEEAAAQLKYPIVVKECFGSFGKQVYLASNREELTEIRAQKLKVPHIYQRFLSQSRGRDVRVLVIGGQAVCAMERKNDRDFRSNIELGGKGYPIALPEEFRSAAERAANLLGLVYCGVDLLYGADGEPVVCEVNSNAYFNAISAVTGTDVAQRYADYIVEELINNRFSG